MEQYFFITLPSSINKIIGNIYTSIVGTTTPVNYIISCEETIGEDGDK